jgi:sulfide:quinone oxidoreductase
MSFTGLSENYSVAAQLSLEDVQAAAALGFKTIICNRPDGEQAGQPSAEEIAAQATALGMAFVHIPVISGAITQDDVTAQAKVLQSQPGPVLAYCRSGARCTQLYSHAQALMAAASPCYDVLIVGGGAAGIATATSLRKRSPSLSIAIIDPAQEHYYQPGWTMVGAGVFSAEQTRRTQASVMPHGVTWLQQAVSSFQPEHNQVTLADGGTVSYEMLVVCPGLKLDWAAILGLSEALGKNGVTSNYRYDLAPYTQQLVQETQGGKALFTQPPMPIKCAGAPQKAMYLSCFQWEKRGSLGQTQVAFHNAGAVLFGVAHYVPALMKYIERYGIALHYESKLVAIDGARKIATFEQKQGDAVARVEESFDMIHVVPPQTAPDFIKASPLAAASGYVEVNEATLQHKRYANIFALGDAAGTSNAKTAAAVRKQAPVVAVNLLAARAGKPLPALYDGYGSCPLTVESGKIVLAEFGYGGKLLPSFPKWLINGDKPQRISWLLKKSILPWVYWNALLKGREWLVKPKLAAPHA